MKTSKISPQWISRRGFLLTGAQAAAGAAVAASLNAAATSTAIAAAEESAASSAPAPGYEMPCGMIGKVKISRLLLGGNLISGCMHCRDLKYVPTLFRAYVTEDKLMETFRLAEQYGINTVFETGGEYVRKYNQKFGGSLQFIPHIQVPADQSDAALKDHIRQQVDTGAVALYVWGVSADSLVQNNRVDRLAKAVDLAKATGLPVGVGGHSLQVPMACEKLKVPCDFYVKTLHTDDYPSATPKERRTDFMWQGSPAFWDNMWCIDPEETIAFFKTVTKPWLAYKVLAAGAIYPKDGFAYAFKNGADFVAVGMFDFQLKEDSELVCKIVRRTQQRERQWVGLA
jgi:hypothetical protein